MHHRVPNFALNVASKLAKSGQVILPKQSHPLEGIGFLTVNYSFITSHAFRRKRASSVLPDTLDSTRLPLHKQVYNRIPFHNTQSYGIFPHKIITIMAL